MTENETPTKERARKDDWTTDNKKRTIIHRMGMPFQRDARLKHTWGKRKNDSKKYDLPGPSPLPGEVACLATYQRKAEDRRLDITSPSKVIGGEPAMEDA